MRDQGQTDRRRWLGVACGLWISVNCVYCASVPTVPPPVVVTDTQKLAWILRLEDQRILRDPSIPTPGPASLDDGDGELTAVELPVAMRSPTPDLLRLVEDTSAAVRRRAALAIGRVGLEAGVQALVVALSDPQTEVREIAAFGLGLIADPSAIEPLVTAMGDPSPVVQGQAARALGRLGATAAIDVIQAMVASHVTAAYDVIPDELGYPLAPRVEAFRAGLYALSDLGAYDALAATVLTDEGDPLLWWWPVGYALASAGDVRAVGPLRTLAGIQGTIGVAMAANGLGGLGEPTAVPALLQLLDLTRRDPRVVMAAVQALGELGDLAAADGLYDLLRVPAIEPNLLLVVVDALAAMRAPEVVDVAIELLSHPWAPLRGAAIRALARLDPDTLLLVLSGLPPDPQWLVRADIATSLAEVDPDVAAFRLSPLLDDEDRRVIPSVLRALAASRAPNAMAVMQQHLGDEDVVIRKTAALLLGESGSRSAVEPLAAAYRDGLSDSSYLARAAVVDALAQIGGESVRLTLELALEDPDWAVRLRAVDHLSDLAAAAPSFRGGAAPLRLSPEAYSAPELLRPTVSPHVFVETDRGTIQIELAVNEAPLTSDNFMRLARSGFYNGLLVHRVVPNYVVQAGDPRSDSEGGPGYTVRDELSPLPFIRGTVGMALDWADTGGSQFFITLSPQPQLDGRYTAFGTVIGGMDVVDQLQQGDIMRVVRVWDGVTPPG
ncbi:MAG: HEAT repeat domain-containing protein [Acidobacteriota bacterium]|nr:HEAT repeat domain-containing protein [Acidobacteriota bacterium]